MVKGLYPIQRQPAYNHILKQNALWNIIRKLWKIKFWSHNFFALLQRQKATRNIDILCAKSSTYVKAVGQIIRINCNLHFNNDDILYAVAVPSLFLLQEQNGIENC